MGKYRTKGDDFYNKKIIVKIYFINKLLNVIFKYKNHENKKGTYRFPSYQQLK